MRHEMRAGAEELQSALDALEATAAANPAAGIGSEDIWAIHEALVQQNSVHNYQDNPGRIPTELRQFLDTPLVSQTSDPLKVWHAIKGQYKHLYAVAMKYLPQPATSVPSNIT